MIASYAKVLSQANSSVGQIEDSIRSQISEDGVRSQLAQEGIQSRIKRRVGTVSSKDVTDSYNVYTVREIVVPKGSMPADQLKTRVDKIISKARAGGELRGACKGILSGQG